MTDSEQRAWASRRPSSEALAAVKDAYDAREWAEELLKIRSAKLAEAVRQARKTHSLAEIAQELGVSRQRIHQISEEK